jgi:cyclohexadieny/prephenate dehydrogenase
MAELSVGIIGLGRLGLSVGMSLHRYNTSPNANNRFTLYGSDLRPRVEKFARNTGIFESIGSQHDAASHRDLVVLDTTYANLRETFRAIAPSLRDGCVVLDLSPLKQPSIEWSSDFSSEVYLVGATPVLNPVYLWDGLDDTEHAAPDLFDGGTFMLAPSPSAERDAVELVTQVVSILGAAVHYVDPAEHDGVIAAEHGLPALLGIAAFRALTSMPGWSEARRITNPSFARLTHHLMDTHPDDMRDMLLHNRENTLRYLDATMAALNELRDVLAEGDRDAVEAALVDAEKQYQRWVSGRSSGKWDEEDAPQFSASDTLLSGMLGGFLAGRLRGNKKDN